MTTAMAPREDLINSAVTFLQDPSVASAPLEQRRSFLQSKNLTVEEIQLALARAGENPVAQQYAQPSYYTNQQQQPSPYGYNYAPFPPQGAWPQQTEPPRRDWRDWFIMATVTTGLGYGLYSVAKRYITPLIVPPTPLQLESDKAAIDASFTRAFDLIEQLSNDTAALKTAETQRQEKLDSALEEVNAVVEELKTANKRREEESRRLGDEVRNLREMIPKALDGWKAQGDDRVKELGTELRSLKLLIGNRVGNTTSAISASTNGITPSAKSENETTALASPASTANTEATPAARKPSSRDPPATTTLAPAPGVNAPRSQSGSTTPFNFESRASGRSIPAWQMAAANKSIETNAATSSTTDSPPQSVAS